MRFVLRLALLAAIFTLPLAAPASAQYMYLDANGDGVHTAADQLNTNGTATTVDVWLDTDSNRDGSDAVCNDGTNNLDILSYVFWLEAVNGTATYSGFINRQAGFTTNFGQVNTGNSIYKNGHGGALSALLSPGLYRLATITVTGETGSPRLDITDNGPGSADITSFGGNCFGNDFDNTYKLVGPSGVGTDWTDADGLAAAPGGGNVDPTLTVPANANGAEGTLLTINASATDPDVADVLTISQTNNAPFLTFTHTPRVSPATASLAGTPNFDQAGAYTVNWTVDDGNGGTDAATTSINIAQTNRPPVLNAIGNRTTNVGQLLTFTAVAVDPDGGALLYTLDAGSPAGAAINGTTGVFTWTPGSAGAFPVTIRVSDAALAEDFEAIAITVNAPANVAPTLGAIGNKTVAELATLTFTATATDPDAGSVLTFSLDAGAPAGATIGGTTGAFSWTPTEAQGPAATPITVRVTDNGTPALNDFETITVTVNEINVAPVLGAIGNRTVAELATLAFTATATDADLPANTLTFSLGAGAPAGATIGGASGAFSWTPTETQGPAATPITIIVTDNGTPALNDNELITVTVTEVNVAPVLAAIGNLAATVGVAVTFTATATDADLPANTLTFSLDAGAPAGATIGGSTGAFTWTPASGQIGANQLTVRVTDNGTPALSDFETITITVGSAPNQAPVLGAIGNKTAAELATLAFTATATDPDASQIFTFTLGAGAPAGAAINGTSGAFTWTPTEAQGPGAFPITVVVTDNGTPPMNDSETITVTVTEVNVAPVLTAIGSKTVNELAALTFTATATDADLPANTLSFSLGAGVPAGATINAGTGAFSWTPTEAQGPGSFPITVVVTDNGTPALNDSELITVTVTEVNAAPVLGAIGNRTVAELATLAFTATASDADLPANTLTFTLGAGAPAGSAINATTGAFSWTPTEAQGPGSFPITVVVTDNGTPALNDSEAITVTVTEVNAAPVLVGIGDKAGTVGVPVTFTATATDADIPANTLSFSLDAGNPSGSTINATTGAFSWTPATNGTFPVTVRVTDNGTPALDDFETISIVVSAAPNQAPVLGAIGNKTIAENNILSFTATATDPDAGQTLTFSLDAGAPAGATINGGTGVFSWQTIEDQGGQDFPITVRVTDSGTPPLSDSETITITVNEVNVAPVLATIGNKSGTTGVPVTFTATATDADLPANALAFSLDAGTPAGATINASTGAFSFTPGSAGSFPVTVRVTDDGTPALSDFESITIDVGGAPNQAPVLGAIGNKTVNELEALAFTATATDPDAGSILTFSLDAPSPAGATIDGSTGAFSWTPTEAQGPAIIPITVRVTDNGSPALSDFETIAVAILEVNVAPVLAAIGDKSGTVGVPVTFTATATDADIPVNALAFSLDAGGPTGATINASTGAFSFTPGAAGSFPVTVRVTDDGTPALSDFEAITITATEADVNEAPVLAAIGNKTVDEQTLLAFTATATDADGDALTFTLDAGAPADAAITAGGAFSWTPAEIDGPDDYSVTVRVTDNGTPVLDDSETITITVNEVNLPPALAAIGNKSGAVGAAIAFTASATDNDIPTNEMTFSLDAGAPAGATIDPTTGEFSWTPPGAGTFQITVRVTDNGSPVGEDFEELTITVEEADVNEAPVLAAIGNKTVDEQTPLAFTATATDADGDALTFTLDAGAPAGTAITTGGALSWTPTEAQGPGTYPVTVRVTDNGSPALDDFETITITVNEVNVAPVLAAIGNKTGTVGSAVTFMATATDADLPANALAFSLDAGAPVGATINGSTGAFSFTPGAAGAFPVTVRVTDNGTPALSDFEAITINVTAPSTNRPPMLNAIANKTINEGALLSFLAVASDPDAGQTKTFSLDAGAPAGAAISAAGAFTWTPTEAQGPGDYSITVRVTDNGTPPLSDAKTFQVKVRELNVAPVLAPIGNKTIGEGQVLIFTATATDADLPANVLTFSLGSGAPSGATIGSASGVFRWTPSVAGNYSVKIRVKDNGSPVKEDFETIRITVTTDVLPAHAFFFGINRITVLGIKLGTCVQIEPVRGSYSNQDVDLNSIVMRYRDEEISARCEAEIDGDKNHNGVREITACFTNEDLQELFSGLGRGLHQVEVALEGRLNNGTRFRDFVRHYVLVLGLDCMRLTASPNPINPETVLSLVTTQSGPVKIQIFDVQGRLVRGLYDGTMPAGINQVRWDGTNRTGNRVATGVYFVKVKALDGEQNLRLTVLK